MFEDLSIGSQKPCAPFQWSVWHRNAIDELNEEGQNLSLTGSNHVSNRVEPYVGRGRIMIRTGSDDESNTDK